jgi:hypothetical protein
MQAPRLTYHRQRHLLRTGLALIAVVVLLLLPGAAGAGSQNYYTGWLTPSDPFDWDCIWYGGPGEACSGWNYWYENDWNVSNCGVSSWMFIGFQNNARWRHRESYVGDGAGYCLPAVINPSDLEMGGQYLKSHIMYSSGASTYGYAWTFA